MRKACHNQLDIEVGPEPGGDVERLLRDLRYAIRGLRGAPGFALVAVVTLALGIGVNSTIFSLVNAVLYRPPQVEAPDELVDIYSRNATSTSHDATSYPNYQDYREQAGTLEDIAAFTNFFANLSIDGSSELVVGEMVSDNYFRTFGVRPMLGRAFSDDEVATPGGSPVAILSYPFWRSRFGAEPDVLGESIRLNGLAYTVVGVAPKGFGGMFPAVTAQMWIPATMVDRVDPLGNHRFTGGSTDGSYLEQRGRHLFWMKGRMADGATVGQVESELETIAGRLADRHPEENEEERVVMVPTGDVAINPDFDGTVAPAGLFLLAAVGLVLLVACANLANMMLARAATRRREIAIRLAIGSSRRRLVGQLLTESMIVALAGGVLAIFLARWLTGVIARFQPPLPIDFALNIEPDWRVLLFTFTAAVLTGIAFGLVPALRASRPDLVPALKDTGEGDARGRKVELRDALVVAQVAFSLMLLVVGGLMVRSFTEAGRVEMGYDIDRTAFLGLPLEMNGYDRDDGPVLVENGRRGLLALPEVEAVGLASRVPQSVNNNGFGIYVDGDPRSEEGRPHIMDGARVDEGYFDVLGLEILEGRGIVSADRDGARRVAVVTETMAERFWPGESAVGRAFRTGVDAEPFQIVGVVEDYKVDTPGEAPKPYLHIPLSRGSLYANYIVRTAVPARGMVASLERELRTLDPDLVFLDTGTLRDLVDVRIFPIRAGAWLIGAFGLLALLLSAVGLYGVISFSVSRRVREMGIRKALGAESGAVVAMVLQRGMVLVLVGGAIGAGLAFAGAQVMSSVLFVPAFDPISFIAGFAVLLAVAALANWVPARRAARTDPMVALRNE